LRNNIVPRLHEHASLATAQPLYQPESRAIDGVTLMAFASVNDVEDFLRSPGQQVIAGDEAGKAVSGVAEYWTAIGCVLVNRVFPELPTRLNR
jgi:hypothetical protein